MEVKPVSFSVQCYGGMQNTPLLKPICARYELDLAQVKLDTVPYQLQKTSNRPLDSVHNFLYVNKVI